MRRMLIVPSCGDLRIVIPFTAAALVVGRRGRRFRVEVVSSKTTTMMLMRNSDVERLSPQPSPRHPELQRATFQAFCDVVDKVPYLVTLYTVAQFRSRDGTQRQRQIYRGRKVVAAGMKAHQATKATDTMTPCLLVGMRPMLSVTAWASP